MCVPEGRKTNPGKDYIALDWCNEMQNAYERFSFELIKPHALEMRSSATTLRSGVNLNALNTRKMPPTKASNLYSTFPLNPTRLPVTSDMACQKLSFTAHGQHGGSKDQIQWSNPSHFFSFRAADIELEDDKTEQVEAAAREREAVQRR